MEIKTAEFVTSMSVYAAPDPALPQIAVAGKSNVGKSSLINSLCRRRSKDQSPGIGIAHILRSADHHPSGYKTDILSCCKHFGQVKDRCVRI